MGDYPLPEFPERLDAGPRLQLRAVRPADADALYALVDQSREHLRTWLPWVDASQSVGFERTFLEHVVRQRELGVTAAYVIRELWSIRGMIGLHDISWDDRSFMIGYWIAAGHEGKGLVTRACRRLLEMAFQDWVMERAVIRCGVGNTRSAAVARRLGFTFEGVARHAQQLHDGFVDLEVYSLLRTELRSAEAPE